MSVAQGEAAGGTAATTGATVADTAVKGEASDVMCGMKIKTEGALSEVYRDTKFYFCSADCQAKFKADPSKAPTGLSGEKCICGDKMKNCTCGHCKGEAEPCACGDPGHDEGDGHDHSKHKH